MIAFQLNRQPHTFVIDAGLVERGVDEFAGAITARDDRAAHRNAVHMHVEHIKENADARARRIAEAEFGVGHDILNRDHPAIRRADNQAGASRRDAVGVAEKIKTPGRQHDAGKQRHAADEQQQQSHPHEHGDKGPSCRMEIKEGVGIFFHKLTFLSPRHAPSWPK